jgi:nucleoside-diphosphate-sugar epimerase
VAARAGYPTESRHISREGTRHRLRRFHLRSASEPDIGFHQFLRSAIRGEPIAVYGDGEQTRDFTFVHDAVNVNVAAAVRGIPGRVYNIGGGSRVSVNTSRARADLGFVPSVELEERLAAEYRWLTGVM